jgi:hypothetical protein
VRERHQWGPVELGVTPSLIAILLRRYLCRSCGAVVVVGPRGLARRRLYSASAIALALALYGIAELSPAEIRRQVSPLRIVGPTAAAGWASLGRWCRAVRAGGLFRGVRALPADATLRQIAARAATTVAAYASGSARLPVESAAFIGASM